MASVIDNKPERVRSDGSSHFVNKISGTDDENSRTAGKNAFKETVSTKGLTFPKRLYGRSKEYQTIVDAWKKNRQSKQILSVSGQPGSGKTVLIKQINSPEFRQSAFFLYGKFDQINSRVPYQAITNAFQTVIDWILGQKNSVFHLWKNRLKETLKENGQLMVEILPDLEKIIGVQPKVLPLTPEAEKNRFVYLFDAFVKTLMNKDMPVFLFIDDLQWADPASMNIIESICLARDLDHLLLACAFRDTEMAPSHRWFDILKNTERRQVGVNQMTLPPFSAEDINALISDMMHLEPGVAAEASETIRIKTGGNPLFVTEFLNAACQKKMIRFSQKEALWKIDLASIRALPVNDDVAVLILERINRFEPATRDILFFAACLGHSFDIPLLSIGCDKPMPEIKDLIDPAVQSGILIPYQDNPQLNEKNKNSFVFAHDSIQKEFLKTYPSARKEVLVAVFAWKIWEHHTVKPLSSNTIFIITGLLNKVFKSESRPDRLKCLAQMNCDCGKNAVDAAAFQTAHDYYVTGIRILEEFNEKHGDGRTIWETDKTLCFELHEGVAVSSFLSNDYKQMDLFFHRVDQAINDPILKTRLYEIKTSSLYARNEMEDAIEVALKYTAQLGVSFPASPGRARVIWEMIRTRLVLRKISVESLADLPEMSDVNIHSALRVISCVTLAALYSKPNLLPVIIFKSIRLSVRYGITESSVFAFAGYGFISCGILNHIDEGIRFGRLAEKLIEKYRLKNIHSRTMATTHGFIYHWRTHLKQTCRPLTAAYKTGRETGDHQFACISAAAMCTARFICGDPLETVGKMIRYYLVKMKELKQDVIYTATVINMQAVLNLKNAVYDPWSLRGSFYDKKKMLPVIKQSNDTLALFTHYYVSELLNVYFNKFSNAVANGNKAWVYFESARALPETAVFVFIDSIARIVQTHYEPFRKNKEKTRIKKNVKLLKHWSSGAPVNHLHRYTFIRALILLSQKKIKKALPKIEAALASSDRSGYVNDQALMNEYAGMFLLLYGHFDTAARYLSQSYDLYCSWGAVNKNRQMKNQYPLFVFRYASEFTPESPVSVPPKHNIHPQINKNIISTFQQDLTTILDAAQTIARETELDIVMEKLIRLVLKNSGAQHAYLFLYKDKKLYLEASARTEPFETQILQGRLFDDGFQNLPCSILHYVMRSDQVVILENAIQSEQFCGDAYIISGHPVSILCSPFHHKNRKAGILYLEHRDETKKFSSERMEILNILLSQAIVTIENAKLYENLTREKEKKKAAKSTIDIHKKVLKNMSAELAMVEERERKSIADDLHDSASQTLALTLLNLKKLKEEADCPVKGRLSDIQKSLTQAVEEIRSLTFQLSPRLLYDFGLETALEWLADDMRGRHGLEVVLINNLETKLELNETLNILLFRAVRELLINIVKHARSSLAFIIFDRQSGHLVLKVKDKGKGFDSTGPEAETQMGYGLYRVHERILGINGRVEIDSDPGRGSQIKILIPMDQIENK